MLSRIRKGRNSRLGLRGFESLENKVMMAADTGLALSNLAESNVEHLEAETAAYQVSGEIDKYQVSGDVDQYQVSGEIDEYQTGGGCC